MLLELVLAIFLSCFAFISLEWTIDLYLADLEFSYRVFLLATLTTLLSLQPCRVIFLLFQALIGRFFSRWILN